MLSRGVWVALVQQRCGEGALFILGAFHCHKHASQAVCVVCRPKGVASLSGLSDKDKRHKPETVPSGSLRPAASKGKQTNECIAKSILRTDCDSLALPRKFRHGPTQPHSHRMAGLGHVQTCGPRRCLPDVLRIPLQGWNSNDNVPLPLCWVRISQKQKLEPEHQCPPSDLVRDRICPVPTNCDLLPPDHADATLPCSTSCEGSWRLRQLLLLPLLKHKLVLALAKLDKENGLDAMVRGRKPPSHIVAEQCE